jgi:DNA-binding transcriptional ArsR family regulator
MMGTTGSAGTVSGAVEVMERILVRRSTNIVARLFDISRTMAFAMSENHLVHPRTEDLELPAVLHALSDPVRLQIVRALSDHGACNCGTFAVPVAKSTLSHHLKVLRDAGLTFTEPAGTARVVSLRREDLAARFPGLLDAVLTAAPAAA